LNQVTFHTLLILLFNQAVMHIISYASHNVLPLVAFPQLADSITRFLFLQEPLLAGIVRAVGISPKDSPIVLISKDPEQGLRHRLFIVGETFWPFGFNITCPNTNLNDDDHTLEFKPKLRQTCYKITCAACDTRVGDFMLPSGCVAHGFNAYEMDFPSPIPNLDWQPIIRQPQVPRQQNVGESSGEQQDPLIAKRRWP